MGRKVVLTAELAIKVYAVPAQDRVSIWPPFMSVVMEAIFNRNKEERAWLLPTRSEMILELTVLLDSIHSHSVVDRSHIAVEKFFSFYPGSYLA